MKRLMILVLFFPLTVLAQGTPSKTKKLPTQLPPKRPPQEASKTDATQAEAAAKAAAKRSRIPLESARTIRLTYGYPAWNKSSTKIDSATVILREGGSGRMVQIQLEETEPDSAIFSGLYSVNWENIEQIKPEFYVPPQEMVGTAKGIQRLNEMIAKNELKRKPFVLRREKSGRQNIEVFDTREQAQTALQTYRGQQLLEQRAVEAQQKKQLPSESTLEAARMAKDLELREAAAQNATERVRLGQVQRAKLLEQLRKFAALPEAEQTRRKAQAAELAKEGLEHYGKNEFLEAQKKFDAAIELDPTNKGYYFQYGVTHYRNEHFNRALVFLDLAEGAEINEGEKQFYMGLSYYRLKDYDTAKAAFQKVKEAKVPELGPSAAFYQGIVLYEQEEYKPAQAAFQEVLDTSTDPRLDENAELYIELILRKLQFAHERARPFRIAATFGGMYDSNVLLTSDSALDQGTASDSAGVRLLTTGTFEYRPVFNEHHEWALQADILGMYTMTDGFQSASDLHAADPYVLTLTSPYRYKGVLAGKGYKMELIPGFETISMSIENDEQKPIVRSFVLNWLNTLVVSDRWFTSYNLEARQDNSLLESSTGDNDATAIKTKFAFNNIIFATSKKDKIITADVAHTINSANGDNVKYNRTDLAVGFIAPTVWDLTWNTRLSYFLLTYDKNPSNRVDNSFTLSGGVSKKLTEIFSAGVLGSYNVNGSTVEANQYTRFNLLTTISAGYRF